MVFQVRQSEIEVVVVHSQHPLSKLEERRLDQFVHAASGKPLMKYRKLVDVSADCCELTVLESIVVIADVVDVR